MRSYITATYLSLFIILFANCVYAQVEFDATHLFEEETRWLADNFEKETRAEFDLRTKGVVQYVDRKPPTVGDVETFKAFNVATKSFYTLEAILKRIGKHCYVYLEKGKTLSDAVLNKIMNQFDNHIYPLTTSMFGSEWNPGIDGDPRITLLLLDIQDGFDGKQNLGFTAGYFYAGNEYTVEKNPNSNEREMLYLDIYPANPEKDSYMSVVAHEFQHMIHWHADPKEFTWLNESMSQFASFLNGFGHPSQLLSFIKSPDNSMVSWSGPNMIANYGQVYLFAYYLVLQQSSKQKKMELLRTLVQSKRRGTLSVEAGLRKVGKKDDIARVFGEFCVANFLNDPTAGNGEYAYDESLLKMKFPIMVRHSSEPFTGRGSVRIWSAQAIEFDISNHVGPLKISFKGQTKIANGNLRNRFDVAAVLKDGKEKPVVEWLNISNNSCEQTLRTQTKGYKSLLLVVVNTGPQGEDEVAYSRAAESVEFIYAVTDLKKNTNLASSNKKPKRASPRTLRNIIESIIAGNDKIQSLQPESNNDPILTTVLTAEIDRINQDENLIIDTIRNEIESGKYTLLTEFSNLYNSLDQSKKHSLTGITKKINKLLHYEIHQNNRSELTKFLLNP